MWHCSVKASSLRDSPAQRNLPANAWKSRKNCLRQGCTRRSNALYDGQNADHKPAARPRFSGHLIDGSHLIRPAAPARRLSSADKSVEQATLIGTLAHLWPYIWPGDRVDLKMRVVWSVVLLLVAKLATLSVPFTFKWAIDALTGADTAPVQSSNWTLWLIASPLIMTAELRRLARPDGGADPMARRNFRARGDARGAQARLSSPSSTCMSCRCAFIWSARPAD